MLSEQLFYVAWQLLCFSKVGNESRPIEGYALYVNRADIIGYPKSEEPCL
jgi:hypothetical protein